jgi:endonuclease III
MDNERQKIVEKYMEQMMKVAREAGQMLDKSIHEIEASSKDLMGTVSRETKGNANEMKRMASEIVGEVRNDLPKARAELKEMEARVHEKMREFRRT